ncbi:hypothetical protein FOCC_FOCC011212 [Frankliniella occidentalis]|nr:hypothetical protein FOCC_FOCC011212 [Frankliniella occidentalis]
MLLPLAWSTAAPRSRALSDDMTFQEKHGTFLGGENMEEHDIKSFIPGMAVEIAERQTERTTSRLLQCSRLLTVASAFWKEGTKEKEKGEEGGGGGAEEEEEEEGLRDTTLHCLTIFWRQKRFWYPYLKQYSKGVKEVHSQSKITPQTIRFENQYGSNLPNKFKHGSSRAEKRLEQEQARSSSKGKSADVSGHGEGLGRACRRYLCRDKLHPPRPSQTPVGQEEDEEEDEEEEDEEEEDGEEEDGEDDEDEGDDEDEEEEDAQENEEENELNPLRNIGGLYFDLFRLQLQCFLGNSLER